MIYASSHQSLIAAMGKEYIVEDIHIASKEEIAGKTLDSPAKGNDDLLSKSEKNIREAVCRFFLLFFSSFLIEAIGRRKD